MKLRWLRYLLLVALPISALSPLSSAPAADGPGSIQGVLYVSYPGDLSFDVMFAADVDVLLINANVVNKEFDRLKQKLVPPVRAQETAVTKAIVDVRSPASGDKLKEKQEALKRERLALEKLRANYENEIIGMLAKNTIKRTKTDKKGNFKFVAVSPGRYLVHARYELRGTENKYFWLYAVESKAGEQVEVNLNKTNIIHLYELPSAEKEGGQ